MTRSTSRRSFLRSSLSVAAGSLLIAGTKASGDFRGANEAIRIAICGINGRGGAHISEVHANFIVASKDATAADVWELISRVRAMVAQRTGVSLHPEVRFLGEFS